MAAIASGASATGFAVPGDRHDLRNSQVTSIER